MCVLLLIITIWDVVDSILLLLPASFTYGTYSKISKCVRLITGIAETLIFVVLFVRIINNFTPGVAFVLFFAYYVLKLILKLVTYKKVKQIK